MIPFAVHSYVELHCLLSVPHLLWYEPENHESKIIVVVNIVFIMY